MHILDNIEVSGVYFIKNRENGRVYIGCSEMVDVRIQQHDHMLRRGQHHNPELQHDFNTYGRDAFDVGMIQELPPGINGIPIESAFVRAFSSDDPGRLYNANIAPSRRRARLVARLTWLELSA